MMITTGHEHDGLALVTLFGFVDRLDVLWSLGTVNDANPLLARAHYLGPMWSGGRIVVTGQRRGEIVACQIWKHPTSRRLPADGSWLELARWCLTPAAGPCAGSRMHRYALRLIREVAPQTQALVSYSDPSHGHTGALYRACNWQWAPTWMRLRPPPSGHGAWTPGEPESIKDRWVFRVSKRADIWPVVAVDDLAAVRHWRKSHPPNEDAWARTHPQLGAAA